MGLIARIAISGSHATGKSTLATELGRRLGLPVVEEPYYALADEGHPFEDVPSRDDFEAMLDRAIDDLSTTPAAGAVFDRCPADYLAYLSALRKGGDVAEEIARAARAIATLDLIVFVPVEHPDRIQPSRDERLRLRTRVDQALRRLLIDDDLCADTPIIEVSGPVNERAEQVLAAVTRR